MRRFVWIFLRNFAGFWDNLMKNRILRDCLEGTWRFFRENFGEFRKTLGVFTDNFKDFTGLLEFLGFFWPDLG